MPGPSESAALPERLVQPLWEWVQSCSINDRFLIRDVDAELRLDLGGTNSAAGVATALLALRVQALAEPAFLLDVVDTILDRRHKLAQTWFVAATARLETILEPEDCPYSVRPDGSGLIRPDAVEAAAPGGLPTGPGAYHLALAWASAYSSVPPDPPASYAESVLAVEAALAAPGVEGGGLEAVLVELRAEPATWQLEIAGAAAEDGVRTVAAMVSLLRDGQTPGSGAVTEQQARAAVHLATTLVAWAADGALHRGRTTPSG